MNVAAVATGVAGAAWARARPSGWGQRGPVWAELGAWGLQLQPDQGRHGPPGPTPP